MKPKPVGQLARATQMFFMSQLTEQMKDLDESPRAVAMREGGAGDAKEPAGPSPLGDEGGAGGSGEEGSALAALAKRGAKARPRPKLTTRPSEVKVKEEAEDEAEEKLKVQGEADAKEKLKARDDAEATAVEAEGHQDAESDEEMLVEAEGDPRGPRGGHGPVKGEEKAGEEGGAEKKLLDADIPICVSICLDLSAASVWVGVWA